MGIRWIKQQLGSSESRITSDVLKMFGRHGWKMQHFRCCSIIYGGFFIVSDDFPMIFHTHTQTSRTHDLAWGYTSCVWWYRRVIGFVMYLNLPPSRNLRLMLERFQPSWQASLASEVNLRLIDLRGIPKTVTNYLKIGNPMINSQGIYEVCTNPLLSLMLIYSLLERKSIIPGGSGATPPRSPEVSNLHQLNP